MKFEDIEYSIPRGWVKAFGQMLVDEVNAIAPESEVLDAKEKWGSLRLHLYHKHDYDEVEKIVDKYAVLSQNICIDCGKPDVKVADFGWVSPICEDCLKKLHPDLSYEECVDDDDDGRMKDSYTVESWTDDDYKAEKYDISKTANQIRERWKISEHIY